MQNRHIAVICLQSAVSAVQLFGNSIISSNQGLLPPNFGSFFTSLDGIPQQDDQIYSDFDAAPAKEVPVPELTGLWQGGFDGGFMSD